MNRFKTSISLSLGLVVVFQTVFMALPANAFAFSWPFAGGVPSRLKCLSATPIGLWLSPVRLWACPISRKA